MSSRHDWILEVIKEHDKKKPFAPENGKELAFNVGDEVIYLGCDGDEAADMERTFLVTGLYLPNPMTALYASGYRYMLKWSSHWMPVKESSIQLKRLAT